MLIQIPSSQALHCILSVRVNDSRIKRLRLYTTCVGDDVVFILFTEMIKLDFHLDSLEFEPWTQSVVGSKSPIECLLLEVDFLKYRFVYS